MVEDVAGAADATGSAGPAVADGASDDGAADDDDGDGGDGAVADTVAVVGVGIAMLRR